MFRCTQLICYAFILFAIVSCTPQPSLKALPNDAIVLAFGDSLTYGIGASVETSYPKILEHLIGRKVVNAGIPGEETSGGVERIAAELELHRPQLVIVFLGGNDILRKRPFDNIKNNLRKIIQKVQGSGAQVILIAVPNFTIASTVSPLFQELGSELKIPVEGDTVPRLMHLQKYKSDYIHFNQEGYKVLATAIANFLQELGAVKLTKTS